MLQLVLKGAHSPVEFTIAIKDSAPANASRPVGIDDNRLYVCCPHCTCSFGLSSASIYREKGLFLRICLFMCHAIKHWHKVPKNL